MTFSSSTICKPDLRTVSLTVLGAALAILLAGSLVLAREGNHATDRAGDYVVEAQRFLAKSDGPAAEARLLEAVRKGVPRKAIAAPMGQALLEQGLLARARQWLGDGEFSPATAVQGFRALASLELREGDIAGAGAAYDRALSLAPDDASLWAEVARYRYVGGEHLLAIEAADHALALDPASADALRLRAELVRDRDGVVPALPWFEKALERAPDDVALLGEYAATLGDAGQAVQMLAATRRMLALDPRNAQAFYLQSVMAARAGNYGLARRLFLRTGNKLDNSPGAMLLEGVLELGAHNYALAVEALDRLVRLQPANRRANELLARALFLSGEYQIVVDRFGADANEKGVSPYLKMVVARAYEQLGRRDRAALLLDEISGPPRMPVIVVPANRPIGMMLASGDFGNAQTLTDRWVGQNPGNFDNLSLAGDVRLASGDARGAVQYYDRAARIRMPESLLTRRFQAMIMAGEMGRAADLVTRALESNPMSGEARRLSAWLSASSGDWDRAGVLYRSLLDTGGSRDIQLLSDLALVEIKAGAADDARRTASRAGRVLRQSPVAAQALGLVLAADRSEDGPDRARSLALLDKARKMMGDSPLLVEGRVRLAAGRGE